MNLNRLLMALALLGVPMNLFAGIVLKIELDHLCAADPAGIIEEVPVKLEYIDTNGEKKVVNRRTGEGGVLSVELDADEGAEVKVTFVSTAVNYVPSNQFVVEVRGIVVEGDETGVYSKERSDECQAFVNEYGVESILKRTESMTAEQRVIYFKQRFEGAVVDPSLSKVFVSRFPDIELKPLKNSIEGGYRS